MTRGISLVLAAVLCLSLVPATAMATDSDFTIENGVITKYNGSATEVVIPSEVTSIGDNAFVGCKSLKSVTLSANIASIGHYAFAGCESLTGITIPGSVKSIGVSAFSGCKSLRKLVISDGVADINRHAFDGCENLTEAVIPDSVKPVSQGMFRNCTNLKKVILPSGLTAIGAWMFENCENLTDISIPDSVTSIDQWAFENCKSLKRVTIPDGVSIIGERAFRYCESLESVTIPAGVETIEPQAFRGCKKLTDITILNGVTYILNDAFQDCPDLKNATIPESVKRIGATAFHVKISDKYVPIPGLTIYGTPGSYAESYAKKQGVKFLTANSSSPSPDKPSNWATKAIEGAIAENLVPKDLQNKYGQATSRAEFCALAVRLYETVTGTEITERKTFADTTDVNVEKAAAIGVVDGVGASKFDPYAGLTREQAATMLSRLATAVGKPLPTQASNFADKSSVSVWAMDAVGEMQATGIMGGVGNNQFSPKGAYTKEQSIVTILRLYDIVK